MCVEGDLFVFFKISKRDFMVIREMRVTWNRATSVTLRLK